MTTIAQACSELDTLRRRVDTLTRLNDELALQRDACQCNELDEENRRLRCRLQDMGVEP